MVQRLLTNSAKHRYTIDECTIDGYSINGYTIKVLTYPNYVI